MTKLIAVLALFAVMLSVAAGTATARTRDVPTSSRLQLPLGSSRHSQSC